MAKKKAVKKKAVNKSAEIRKYLARHPSAGPKSIQSALAAKGIQVSQALVSHVKYSAKAGKASSNAKRAKKATTRKSKGAKKRKGTKRRSTRTRPSDDLKQAGDLMRQAVDLVISAGAKEAKQLVSVAEEMVRTIRSRRLGDSRSRACP